MCVCVCCLHSLSILWQSTRSPKIQLRPTASTVCSTHIHDSKPGNKNVQLTGRLNLQHNKHGKL